MSACNQLHLMCDVAEQNGFLMFLSLFCFSRTPERDGDEEQLLLKSFLGIYTVRLFISAVNQVTVYATPYQHIDVYSGEKVHTETSIFGNN